MALIKKKVKTESAKPALAMIMLRWYDLHARVLPWRAPPRTFGDPYHVWLSEVMLQQTTVTAVIPYFQKFIRKWPTIEALAAADLQEVLTAWAGLGYYSRAHRLHDCANTLVHEYGGRLPSQPADLEELPGFGPYTAAAVASIAFGKVANVVDGNIERVMARLHAVETPLPQAKPRLRELAALHVPEQRCGDYAQALMDLGATICTPRQPQCGKCPLKSRCLAFQMGRATDFPRRAAQKKKPVRRTMAFVLLNKKNEIFLCQRSQKGLLAGMMEVPSSPWVSVSYDAQLAERDYQPIVARWRVARGGVRHVFTHFTLDIDVAAAVTGKRLAPSRPGVWVPLDAIGQQALPSVMQRIVRLGLNTLLSDTNETE